MNFSLDRLENEVGYPIKLTLELEDCTIVLFETEGRSVSSTYIEREYPRNGGENSEQMPKDTDVRPNTNVCAVETDGKLRWIIEPQVSANSESRYTEIGTQLEPPEGNQVWVRHSDGRVHDGDQYTESVWTRHTNGYAYVLDRHDGSIVETFSGGVNTIHVDGTELSFEYPIDTTVRISDRTLVLLETNRFLPISENRTELFERNVVAVDDTGTRAWQIEGLPTDRSSGGYTDIWVADGIAYANHDKYGSVRIDPASGTIEEVTAATLQNVLLVDKETAVVFPEGLGTAVDRGTHVITRMAPEDWADEASMYRVDGKLSNLTPSLETVVEVDDLQHDANVFSIDKSGELRWTIDQAPAGEKDPRYTEVGTHFQIGDEVWAKHSNGLLYSIDERDGSHSEAIDQSVVQFPNYPVEFPYGVDTVLETDETIVVLLDVTSPALPENAIPDESGKPLADQNILGFDRSGNLRWVIDAVRPDNPYTDIWEDSDAIGFRNWSSCQGKIAPTTGDILESYFVK